MTLGLSSSKVLLAVVLASGFLPAVAQQGEQDDVSKALDSTATQWSYQFAYQAMPDYHDDTVDGQQRPEGATDFVQLRIVAPIALEKFTILPRLTLRHYENAQGQSGIGNTELFGLIIPESFRSWRELSFWRKCPSRSRRAPTRTRRAIRPSSRSATF